MTDPDSALGEDHAPLLRHALAALAYRTQVALRGAPAGFGDFVAGPGLRTPSELVRHMTSVLGYARTFFDGGTYTAEPLPTLDDEVRRFHAMLDELSRRLAGRLPTDPLASPQRLLQGPLADALTHAGQLAMLRRLAGAPVPPENYLKADIRTENVGPEQPAPASPGRRDGTWDPRGVVREAGAGFGLQRIGQIAVPVADIDRAVAFYRDTLGLRFLFQAPPGLGFFDCAGVRLMLDAQAGKLGTVLYYVVPDLQAAFEVLLSRGVTFERPPHLVAKLPDHELWTAFFRDPDGNLLALMSEV